MGNRKRRRRTRNTTTGHKWTKHSTFNSDKLNKLHSKIGNLCNRSRPPDVLSSISLNDAWHSIHRSRWDHFTRHFISSPYQFQEVSDLRLAIRKITKLAGVRGNVTDTGCFAVIGRNRRALSNLVRAFRVVNARHRGQSGQEQHQMLVFNDNGINEHLPRQDYITTLVDIARQSTKSKKSAMFFVNTLLYMIDPASVALHLPPG